MAHAPSKTLQHLKSRQRYLQLGVFFLMTIMIWVGFSLFHSQRTSSISPELTKLALPLTPTINQAVLESLEAKQTYTDQELSGFTIYKTVRLSDSRTEAIVPLAVSEADLELVRLASVSASPSVASTAAQPWIEPYWYRWFGSSSRCVCWFFSLKW